MAKLTAGTKKTCPRCKETKPLSEFYKHRRKKDGHTTYCKICKRAYKPSAETKEKHKTWKKKYGKTPKGKRVHKKSYRKYALTKKGKERTRKAQLKYHYGISIEEYNRMFEEQKGCCVICGKHQSQGDNGRALGVDHNHITKQVRGLLCGSCNRAIGLLRVDESGVALFLKAIDYINRAQRG